MFATTLSPEKYLDSRRADFSRLTHEIADGKGDLGYVAFADPCTLIVKGQRHEFDSNAAAKAWILRMYW